VSLEHFYKKVHDVCGKFPEDVLSVIAFSVRSKILLTEKTRRAQLN